MWGRVEDSRAGKLLKEAMDRNGQLDAKGNPRCETCGFSLGPDDPPCEECGVDPPARRGKDSKEPQERPRWRIAFEDEDLEHTFVSRYQEVRPVLVPIFATFFRLPRDEQGTLFPSEEEIVLSRDLGISEREEEESLREFVRSCWHAMLQEQHAVHRERQTLEIALAKQRREEAARKRK